MQAVKQPVSKMLQDQYDKLPYFVSDMLSRTLKNDYKYAYIYSCLKNFRSYSMRFEDLEENQNKNCRAVFKVMFSNSESEPPSRVLTKNGREEISVVSSLRYTLPIST